MELEDKVVRAKKGDDNAFYEIVEERKVYLYRTAFMYVKNEQDALDIVSEAVYKAYISIGKLREPKFFNTWLTRILINCAITHTRKNKRTVPVNEEIIGSEPHGQGDTEEVMDLYRAVDKLDGKYKAVVILKYFQDLTLTQAAEILECPVGTAKTYLNRALKELRLELKEEW